MRHKIQIEVQELPAEVKARILTQLKKGDQARIAEMVGVRPEYVKVILRYRPTAKSVMSRRIWLTANRILSDRERLSKECNQ